MPGANPRKILIVSRLNPEPNCGSSIHTEDLVCYLRAEGHDVHYLYLGPQGDYDWARTTVDALYFQQGHGKGASEFDGRVEDWEKAYVAEICGRIFPDVVMADYSWMGDIFDDPYFQNNPTVRKMILVHDLRVRIVPCYVMMGIMRPEMNRWTDEMEGAMLSKADAIITLNSEDQEKAAAISGNVRTLRMGISAVRADAAPAVRIPARCIYVASNLPENVIALKWLLKFVWPRVIAAHGEASLSVCGTIGENVSLHAKAGGLDAGELRRMNVQILGRVKDLGEHYAASEIALVPHFMRGGIKIKHMEAITHGLPVVCSRAGADGLPETVNSSSLAADKAEAFADNILMLMKNREKLEWMRQNTASQALRMTRGRAYREVGEYLGQGVPRQTLV
jgi:glycosyltransferase involved in cell wall biosynthesis